jgi:FtsZ-binding cell division protein ZapB
MQADNKSSLETLRAESDKIKMDVEALQDELRPQLGKIIQTGTEKFVDQLRQLM